MKTWISNRIISWAQKRPPHFIIGGADDPYLFRWWLIPRNPVFNIYVHLFLRSDDDRALHDHPWAFNCSWLMRGQYIEWVPSKTGSMQHPEPMFRREGQVKFRLGGAPHRVQLHATPRGAAACWTLFITGPRVRQWGFYCQKGWVNWRDFTSASDHGAIGKGCEE